MRKLTRADDAAEACRITLEAATALLYAPRGSDAQQPHSRDEIYVVARGEGWFVNGERRERFVPHDVLFAKAGVVHRFEDFSDDFLVWVFFYGPEGGEQDV